MGAVLIGDAQAVVASIASIQSAKDGDLVFVEDEKNLESALSSTATAVIAGDFAGREIKSKPLLLADEPRLAFARAAAWLGENSAVNPGVHASAQVHSSATIHKSVAVEERVVIRDAC